MTTTLDRKEKTVARYDKWQRTANHVDEVHREVSSRIIGRDRELMAIMATLLAGGHALEEGLPGVAKTMLVRTLATALGRSFSRIQFTPDLLPSDVTGFYKPDGSLVEGPLVANLVLADEINRASPRTQAALLEAMGEGQITRDGVTGELPSPFMVLATQNPIEHEGTYPLPEAQLDRFMLKLKFDRITDIGMRRQIVALNLNGGDRVQSVDDGQWLKEAMAIRHGVDVSADMMDLAYDFLESFWDSEKVQYGPAERAHIAMVRIAQALAVIDGKASVNQRHLFEFAPEIVRHRIILKPEHYGEDHDATVESIIAQSISQFLNRELR